MLLDPEHATEATQLRQLADRSGGMLAVLPSLELLETTVPEMLARAGGAYRVRFRAPGWDPRSRRHRLTVTVEAWGRSRSSEQVYATADVLVVPAWRDPRIWLTFAALASLAAALGFALRPRRLFVLMVDSGPERGFSYEVHAVPVAIGAIEGNDLVFPEAGISRNHAVLDRRNGRIEVVDQNSENGTFVNGRRVERQVLKHGDQISLGRVVDLGFLARN